MDTIISKNSIVKKGLQKPFSRKTFIYVISAIFIFRILITLIPSYKVDMGGYRAWSMYIADNGFSGLYKTFHIVYAPLYMYFLFITGHIAKLFNLSAGAHEFLIKMWAGLFDILGGYLIYRIGKKYGKQRTGFILGVIYSFNPGVFFNSSIWGQFDSIPATMLLGVIYFFNLKKKAAAFLLFAAAVLTKPQSGLLAPLVLIAFFRKFSFKKIAHLKRLVFAAVGGFCLYVVTVIPVYSATPFYNNANTSSFFSKIFYQTADLFYWMIHLYRGSLDDYPYATANAFNIWTIFGGQPVHDNQPFMGLTFSSWGFIFLACAIILATILFLKRKNSALALYFSAYFLLFSSFMFATRMHERYLLPAIIFLTVAVIWDSRLWIAMTLLSLCVLANHWYLYYKANNGIYWLSNYDTFAVITAVVTLLVMIYSIYYAIKLINAGKTHVSSQKREE